ncbi:hypothetical protein HAX54_034167 [Datura stramonium]|uniref:Uncharacterized protein n=1 Tax=Datura stramonium TaxID=4076 RepID=A0ABS8RLP9_DATST|nr:hypothetical protein [Datura stramonium]
MGARARGAYNSRGNQLALLGRADPIAPNILQEGGNQSKPIPMVSMLCIRVACPLFRPLDRTMQADHVITLPTKTYKGAPVMKRAKYTGNMNPPPPSASTHTSAAPFHIAEFHNATPPDLFNIAQMVKMNESQLMQLAKDILSMIQLAINKALQPAKYKLTSQCSTVEVLEREMGTLRIEVAALSAPPSTSYATPCEPEAMSMQPQA